MSNGSWDFANKERSALTSDNWVTTWGSTGDIFTAWGDGAGFGGTTPKVSIGYAKLTGPSNAYSGVNIAGGFGAPNPLPFTPGKAQGILALPIGGQNRIYTWVWTQPSGSLCYPFNMKLAKSTDSAATTTLLSSPTFPIAGGFSPQTFLNFGQNYAGALDGYVYMYGFKAIDTNADGCIDYGTEPNDYTKVYMLRVAAANIESSGSYEYYTGTDGSGNPTWGAAGSMQPIFTDTNMTIAGGANAFDVVFNKGIGRYIATVGHGDVAHFGVFDSDNPWGPWTTVEYESAWGGQDWDGGDALGYHMPSKWVGNDGLEMPTIFSTEDSSSEAWDSFNFVRGTASLATSASRIKGISVSTGKPYPTALLNNAKLMYIDTTDRLDNPGGVPAGYQGLEMIRTSNADRTNSSSSFMTFKVNTASTVYVAWDNWVTPPTWLSSAFTLTANDLNSADAGGAVFDVYSKTYSAGSTVTLGGGGASGSGCGGSCSMYIPFVGP